jgi:hypothetical protein
MTVPAPDLRDRLAEALRTTPSVLMDTPEERARHAANPRNHHVSHHYYWGCAMCRGEVDTLADAVLAIVQPELDRLAADRDGHRSGREQLRAISRDHRTERARYRSAWLSARRRAEAYGEGILRHVEDRDTWKGWMRQQEARAFAAEQQLAAVRAYADDLYTAPPKVSACGVRERLLDILTPTGPARTIAEAMAGRPAPVCGDQLTDWTCTLPAGPHPDWRHGDGEHWWTQTRCPADCGQPNTEHHCTKEPTR